MTDNTSRARPEATEAAAGVTPAPTPARRVGAMDVLRSLGDRRVLYMLLIGFGAGLPFLLTGNTLGFWLAEDGVELAAIGFLSWVGLAYSFKFLWAPIIDRFDAPLLGRLLGRRRGWMVLSQSAVGASLIAMAVIGPEGGLTLLALSAVAVAFSSATLDIVTDAWRIETAENRDDLALLTSAYQFGYRIGVIATQSLILFLATAIGWNGSYGVFGALMAIAVVATLLSREPSRAAEQRTGLPSIWTPRGMFDAVVGPFIDFFGRHGAFALLMLLAITLYRLPDFVMGPMTAPFYLDLGLTKPEIASVRLSFGIAGTLAGIALAGLSAIRLGFTPTLLIGAFVAPASNLAYTALAVSGLSISGFSGVIFVENFSEGFAGAALVAYMSSLVGLGYTATQYALLSSFWSISGKFLKGFSGTWVEQLQAATDQMTGYALFFAATAAVAPLSMLLCWFLARRHTREERGRAAAAASG
ncbi:MAG TPA: MFS transporter [Caulobacteraceae bacterium]|jgi:PAT family beta-lactamase induction signal transducer AmpG